MLSHKVKLSAPLTSAETSLSAGQLHLRSKLHAPKGALSWKTDKFRLVGFSDSGIGIRSRLRARSGSALTVPRTVIHYRPVRIPTHLETKNQPKTGWFLFGSGIGIRTPTNRVRVCRANRYTIPLNIAFSRAEFILSPIFMIVKGFTGKSGKGAPLFPIKISR